MKRGYKRLFMFEIILFIILVLNSFVSSILRDYIMVVFLLMVGLAFKLLFGFEKDRHRYTKEILFDLVIFLLIFFLLFYISGILITFARTPNYWNIKDIFNIIIPIILIIILKEYLRYQILAKSEGSKFLIILTTLLFIFLDVSTTLYYVQKQQVYDIFLFTVLDALPSISTNIVCSYMTMKTGYKPMILFRLVMELYLYLLPIVPNPNPYILSIIRLLLPVIFGYRMYLFFKKVQEEREELTRNYRKNNYVYLSLSTIIVIVLVYFVSGYFHYYALAIASGSMSPNIEKGDVVIVEKIEDKSRIEKGEVIAYESNSSIIVHRLVDKIKVDDKYYFYTKGDANNDVDNIVIKEDMIKGIVKLRVPFIGYPTVWLSEL